MTNNREKGSSLVLVLLLLNLTAIIGLGMYLLRSHQPVTESMVQATNGHAATETFAGQYKNGKQEITLVATQLSNRIATLEANMQKLTHILEQVDNRLAKANRKQAIASEYLVSDTGKPTPNPASEELLGYASQISMAANNLVTNAKALGEWQDNDARALKAKWSGLSPAEKKRILSQLAVASNNGEINPVVRPLQ